MKMKKVGSTDIAIVCSALGIIACIILIIDAFLSGGSKTLPIILLCTCSANLCVNVKVKKDKDNK